MPAWKPYSSGGRPMLFQDKPVMSTDDPTPLMRFLTDYYLEH
jgi:hypothetical protein